MDVVEVQANLIEVFRKKLQEHRTALKKSDDLDNDPMLCQAETSRTATAVTTAKMACAAAGIPGTRLSEIMQEELLA